MGILRYLSEIPFWDLICPDYQLQKKCRKSDEIITPSGFPANLTQLLVSRTKICGIIEHYPLDQLNSNSCFLHRATSVKLVSGELTSNARRYDSLDPRLNLLESLFTVTFVSRSHQIGIIEHHSANIRSSLRAVIALNSNYQRTHLHYLRELVYMFQTLQRQPFS